ncbi:hypothetical protein QFZ41_000032 [Luteibacter sp. W1I16]|uniref:DUF6216 family protein n=1 Tax=Luteibacter sp. W1I16 TaxID=3373922 RepID=UPI003D1F09BD
MDLTQTMHDWASQIPTGLVALLQLVGAFLLAVWFYQRAGSGHVFWVRIWTIIHGRRELNDPVIAPWITQRSALMQFRVHAGVRARTHTEAVRLIAWAKDNDEEMGDIARCRGYFDLARPGLKSTLRRWQAALLGAITLVFFLCTCLAILLALTPRAVVSVKHGSGTVLLLSADNIRPLWSTEKYDASDCRTQNHGDIATRVGMPLGEVDTACGWLGEPGLQGKIEETRHDQWVGGHSLAILGLIYMGFPLTWFLTAMAAMAMANRLAARATTQDTGEGLVRVMPAKGAARRRGKRRSSLDVPNEPSP